MKSLAAMAPPTRTSQGLFVSSLASSMTSFPSKVITLTNLAFPSLPGSVLRH